MDKKYVIYKNDLKFKNERNIDVNKIDWEQNNIKHLFNIDHDSINYRLDESKTTNYNCLDLEMTNLEKIPEILFSDTFSNLKYLFLANNKLLGNIDLSFLKKLEICDVTDNKITNITLPQSLIELSACNNNITTFTSNNNLKRLKISYNNISVLNLNNSIENLEINNNSMQKFDFSNFEKLKKIIIYSNPLEKIYLPKKCEYVDLSETNINIIDDLYSVEHLVLNNCKNIRTLPTSENITTLELINTPVEKLYFYKNYELIVVQLNLTKNISSKYKQSNANIKITKNLYLTISRGLNIVDE